MPIDPITGLPYGSRAQQDALKQFDEATKDTPWWVPLASLLFVPFFWALFYLVAGIFEVLLGNIAVVPDALARNYSYIVAASIIIAGGYILFKTGVRKSIYFTMFEGVLGVVSASYALITFPEGGVSAAVSIFGGMVGVADGIRRFVHRSAQQGTPADSQTRR